ncbi:uncharacterized protein LOC128395314 [Panonychus citri]|uniref:uncharacterized protein LOC128395314 n=1 Tax=Panonychus citri TaxID=50023 RepID=UPI002306DDB9|nr:uncharacterized protein LOC128395314 [Panonychus citri]
MASSQVPKLSEIDDMCEKDQEICLELYNLLDFYTKMERKLESAKAQDTSHGNTTGSGENSVDTSTKNHNNDHLNEVHGDEPVQSKIHSDTSDIIDLTGDEVDTSGEI